MLSLLVSALPASLHLSKVASCFVLLCASVPLSGMTLKPDDQAGDESEPKHS